MSRLEKRKKKRPFSREAVRRLFQSQSAKCIYVMLIAGLLISTLFLYATTPQRYDLRVGEISHVTITASKDVVDEYNTEKQRNIAAQTVEPIYILKNEVMSTVMLELEQILAQATAVQKYGHNLLEQQAPGDAVAKRQYSFTEAELTYAHSLLSTLTISDYQLKTLLRATDTQMSDLAANITSAVENTLNTSIREGYVNESIQYIQQIMGYQTNISLLQNVVTPILRIVIQPNMVIDQEATEKLREEARLTVEPIIYKQGQNIIHARERITINQLEMLRSLGLLDDDTVDITLYVGGLLLVIISLLMLYASLWLLDRKSLEQPKRMIIIVSSMILTLLLSIFAQMLTPYFTPTLFAVMMLTSLIGSHAALATSMSISVLVSALIAGSDGSFGAAMVNIMLTGFASGIISILIIRRKPYRQQLLVSGLVTSLTNFTIMVAIGFMTNSSSTDVLNSALWSGASALLASLLCVAINPIFESFFHLATQSKLLELSNPNHPLLRRLLIEASGTYHHSIIVANLAEAAAESVGANPLLARAAAYFHDIGKLKRPLYFKENQIGENPHEHISPYVSAAILTAHTRDGLLMAQQAHLPQEIQDIIIEHHGNTVVMYFYNEALKQANGQPVNISDFRYDGRHPHTKESAIIMLADTVEAAVRSLPDPTPTKIEAFIKKLVNGKLDDGQLDEAPLTLQEISTICKAFQNVLNGVFHERIEYPSPPINATATVAPPEIKVTPALENDLPLTSIVSNKENLNAD